MLNLIRLVFCKEEKLTCHRNMTKESEGGKSSLKREKNESDLNVDKRVFLNSWHFPGLGVN